MFEPIVKYLHEVFPDQSLFFGGICVAAITLIYIVKLFIEGENSGKLLDLAVSYYEDKKRRQQKQNNTLWKRIQDQDDQIDSLIITLKELKKGDEIKGRLIDELRKEIKEGNEDRLEMHKLIEDLTKENRIHAEKA